MAEIILSPVADLIIQTLGSQAVQKIGALYSVRDDLQELGDTLSAIRAVLIDAERKQSHNNQVRFWLERLEDVVSDTDDLVDEVSAEGIRRQLMPARFKKFRIFFSTSNQIYFRHKMAKEIRSLRKRLDKISADRTDFNLVENSRDEIASPAGMSWRETQSSVVEGNVVGRLGDEKEVLKILLESRTEERVGVVAIFGMGGLGKTTLAQLVFKDESVQKHFHEKIWVCVSDDFDEKTIMSKTVESKAKTDDTLEKLQKAFREKMEGKRYLLVLDDIWNENRQKWQNLMSILSTCGESGSRIIVTTREEQIAKHTSSIGQPFRLGILSEKDSWELFQKIAFGQGREPAEASAVDIGMEIVKKCGGVPLAIRMIAGMLSLRDPKSYWPTFLKKELSSISQQHNDILPTLKLSYDRLPSRLKHCFAYCRLFPKDYVIDVETLIALWVAQGFIEEPSDGSQTMEDTGYDYFMDLLWRSFFQEVRIDEITDMVKTCKMHDLVHDLAIQIAGDKYAIYDPGCEASICVKTRHVSLDAGEGVPRSLLKAHRLRSFFRPSWYHSIESESLCRVISNFRFLHMLDLHNSHFNEVPISIGELKHLRYLDLSVNGIRRLPTSITKLVNLQTLKLTRCFFLEELPRDITKLVNLRHLTWSNYHNLRMPREVSQMTNLQTLSYLVFSKDPALCKLDDLMGLNGLRGKLEIRAEKWDGH